MAEEPLVTIVTPSYNMGAFLSETIDSVLSQDYPRIEYLVMDGGSTDGTVGILRRYGNRLRYLSAPDHGAADAINRGCESSQGSIFAWLNADDRYLPGAVSAAVRQLMAAPGVAVAYGEAY
jgi:glycosyltransferase involved in cell wall biosynthesis